MKVALILISSFCLMSISSTAQSSEKNETKTEVKKETRTTPKKAIVPKKVATFEKTTPIHIDKKNNSKMISTSKKEEDVIVE